LVRAFLRRLAVLVKPGLLFLAGRPFAAVGLVLFDLSGLQVGVDLSAMHLGDLDLTRDFVFLGLVEFL